MTPNDMAKLRDWQQRYRDAVFETDPDSQIKALYDCRNLLMECFEPMVRHIEWLDEQCGRLALRVANAETHAAQQTVNPKEMTR